MTVDNPPWISCTDDAKKFCGTILKFYGKFFAIQIRRSGTGSAKKITHDSASFWERL